MINNKEIDNLFRELGYIKRTLPDKSTCYMKDNLHCKFEHVSGLNVYILSSTENRKEADVNLFEDDELYFDLLEDKKILDKLKADLIEFFGGSYE